MDFFLRECWPLLAGTNPTLHIIAGSRHQYFLERYQDIVRINLHQPGIEVEDFVSDVRPAYERAAIVRTLWLIPPGDGPPRLITCFVV